jgi:hypothetical protein
MPFRRKFECHLLGCIVLGCIVLGCTGTARYHRSFALP